jgi:hypothetical protein
MRRYMKKTIAMVCLAAFLSGCANIPYPKIEDYANRYMESLKKNDFASMYGMFYEEAAAAVPYDKFEAIHKSIFDRLGSIKEIGKGRMLSANYSLMGNTYEVAYVIDFEKYKGVYRIRIFTGKHKISILGFGVDSEGLIQ